MSPDTPTGQVKTANPGNISQLTRDELIEESNRLLAESDLAAAYPFLARLAELSLDSHQPSVVAGLAAIKAGRNTDASAHFERALEISPDNADAAYNLALLEMNSGKIDQALGRLRQLARRYPDNPDYQNDLAILWWNKNRPARAEAGFRRALRLNPNFSQARNNAMEFFLQNRMVERGVRKLITPTGKDELTKLL